MPATQTPTIVESPHGPSADVVAAQAAQRTISVSALPKPAEPMKPPKPGSARAKFFDDMQKQFGGQSPTPEAPPAKAPGKPAAKPPAASPTAEAMDSKTEGGDTEHLPSPESKTGGEAVPDQPPAEPAPPVAPAAEPDKGKKLSPWKLVDQFKERALKAEARAIELEKMVVPEEQRKVSETQLQELQGKVKEMTDELRFYRAEKYDPDVIKAKEDYKRALTRAINEFKQVSVTDPATQQPRAVTADDLAELAFMPLSQAQAVAKDVFGDLAPYVMDHRQEIRRLWDSYNAVLEDLKKNGATREQQRTEAGQKAMQEMASFIEQSYQRVNQEVTADPKHGHYFKPREGDTEWNSRLDKGFKLVDEAFKQNAFAPELSKEQRLEIVRKHAAVRNRAAAFGPLRHENDQLRKQVAKLQSELKEFKDTTPAPAGRSAEAPPERPRGMAGLYSDLRKIAH